jgi:hypothetical protein
LVQRPDVQARDRPDERIERLYELLYNRKPDRQEAHVGLEFLRSRDKGSGFGPWEEYAQVLLLSNEFAFVE